MSIERASADLTRLEGELRRLRDRVAEMDAQASRLRTYLAVAREYERAEGHPFLSLDARHAAFAPETAPRHGRTAGISHAAVEGTIELLRAAGKPLHTRDLLTELAARGVVVGGANPVANLSGFLSREKQRLANSRTYGWSLREARAADHAAAPDPSVSPNGTPTLADPNESQAAPADDAGSARASRPARDDPPAQQAETEIKPLAAE